jgi:hypothetical protein
MEKIKRCPRCGIEKSSDSFSRNKASRDGLQSSCKPCRQIIIKAWREKNFEHVKQYGDHYRETHREERRQYNQQWRKQNGAYWRSYQNERLRTNIDYRLRNYIGRAIRRAINKNRQSVFAKLGYSIEELRNHLASLFQPGMSWDNYGTHWHLDHVIPQSWFNLHDENGIDEYEVKLCWSLQNLQPMWTTENLEKKDRYIYYIKLGQLPITYEQFRNILERKKQDHSTFTLQAALINLTTGATTSIPIY